jgi:flagellar basal body-associated protein FliL
MTPTPLSRRIGVKRIILILVVIVVLMMVVQVFKIFRFEISKPTDERETNMVINTVNGETLSHALWIRLKRYNSEVRYSDML